MLITDEDTIHITPNPANVAVSSEEENHWIEVNAVKYVHGETEDSENQVTVDWSHVNNVEFSSSEGGTVMTESQVNDYEAKFIWAKSSVAGAYTIKANTVPDDSEESSKEIEGTLNVINVEFTDVWERNLEHDDSDFPDYGKCIAIEHDD